MHVSTFCSISLDRSMLSLYVSTMYVAKPMSRPIVSSLVYSIEKFAFPYEKLGIRPGSMSLALLCQYVMISGELFFFCLEKKTKQHFLKHQPYRVLSKIQNLGEKLSLTI